MQPWLAQLSRIWYKIDKVQPTKKSRSLTELLETFGIRKEDYRKVILDIEKNRLPNKSSDIEAYLLAMELYYRNPVLICKYSFPVPMAP